MENTGKNIPKNLSEQKFNQLTQLPVVANGPNVHRQHQCSFCESDKGFEVAQGHYWDLCEVKFVRCPQCELIQLDPPIPADLMAQGCHAYYLHESNRETQRAHNRKRWKSFRRGYDFALKLKQLGHTPKKALEVGPGDGFFSIGVRQVFPQIQLHCLDIVPEVVDKLNTEYGFKGHVGEAEAMNINEKFDLIIARDILEHVSNPLTMMTKVSDLLEDQGVFHFITPNGFEDIWPAYCCWKTQGQPFEMLLNHVNYFPAKTLREKLQDVGLTPRTFYTYDFNGTRWGRGRKVKAQLSGPVSSKRSAHRVISSAPPSEEETALVEPQKMAWTQWRPLMGIYCFFKESFRLKIPAEWGVGHEIYGIFQKNQKSH